MMLARLLRTNLSIALYTTVYAACFLYLTFYVNDKVSATEDRLQGWRMKDRFDGFRYEIYGNFREVSNDDRGDDYEEDIERYHEKVVEKARALGCFGWIQYSPDGSHVGEGRCKKHRTESFKNFLLSSENINVSNSLVLDYEDTKIRLHFSSFKILPENRQTCFREVPHACHEKMPRYGYKAAEEMGKNQDEGLSPSIDNALHAKSSLFQTSEL